MGNKSITERIESASKVNLVSKFNIEDLIDNTLLDSIYDEFKNQSALSFEIDEAYKADFTEFNEQKNEFLSDLIKDRVIKEINEAITTGFSTPDFFIEELKEPRFEKYFQVKEKGDAGEYFKKQYKKFFILYLYYKIKTQDLEVTKKDFYESLDSYFGKTSTSEKFFEFETGLRMTFSIMKDLGKTNPKLLYTSLKSLYQSFVTTECENRRKVDVFDYYAEEELFNEIRTYLIGLLTDRNSTDSIQEICIKLILLIGNIRGSGEDFLIAFNLINKHGYEFNIDAELSQCKFIDSSSHDLKEGEADDRLKVSYEGNKSAHILKGGDIDFDFNVEINMTFDSQFIYAYQHGKGLLKLGASDSAATKLGRLISKNSSFSDDHRSFMYLNGKLYCRFKNSDGKPFTLINTETLEEITNNEEFNKKIEALKEKGPEEEKKEAEPEEDEKTEEDKKPEETPTLGWTKEDSEEELKGGRYLCASPLFTDGVDIYVISTIREVKIIRKEDENLDEDRKELAITKWNLEVYDGSTWKFKKSVEIQLDIKHRGIDEHMTEAEEKEIDAIKQLRESFNANHLAYCSFATNGTKLLVGENNRWHSYDINKLKWNFNLELTEGNWAYNYMANTFWQITSSPEVKSFKIPAFKRLETGISHSKGIIEYINNKVKDIQKLQTVADKLTKRTPKNLFKNLMKKADEQTKNPIFETKTKADYSQFLILNILKEGSKELITIAENINPNGPVDNKKLELFRGSFSTAVTGTFFSELLNAVEGSVGLLSKKQKKSSNILEQYNFYMILILLRTSMMCLSKLNIPISTVLYERNDFDRLVKIVEQNISVMVSKEAIDYTIEDGNAHEELSCIWSSIESECRSIMSYCLSLVYESLEDLMRKVTSLLERMDIGQSDNSLGIYINYLTLPETMNKALKSNEIKDLILVVYEKLCMLKTKKLISAIDSVKYETHQLHDVEYSSLEISNEGFIYAVTQNIINLYFEAYRDVEKQKEQSKSDKDKLEMLERKLERTEFDLIKVLERISESTIQILDKCSSSTQYYLDEALKQQKEDDKIEDQEKKPKVTGKMKYVEFHRYLYKIAHLNNNFPNLMHVYVAAFASLKDSTNVKTLSLLSIKILKVIENFSKFKEIVSEDLPLSESEDLLRNNLDKDIIKFFVWTISKLSYSFINVKKVAELSEEEKMNKKILDSKLLSGGIENRFLPILSKDTVSSLRDLCEITADRTIKEYLVNDPKELDEDQVFMAIIHQGKDKNIDRVIDLLQFNMERKHPWAKSAKEEGMRLSRAAFACMIKIGELYTDFIMMVDETEMNADSVDADDEATAKKQLAQELSKIDSYETIFKHWESSAKMRSWYQEKKKSWANKIKKEEEEKKKKDEADSKTTEENKDKENKDKDKENKEKDKVKPKDEKEDKKDDGEEVIDTTTKPTDDNQPKKKTKDQIELAKIIEKVVEKAELLIKLNMPTSWGSKEQTKFNMIETLAEEEEKKIHSSEVKEEIPDWKTRLDKWREIQESAGSIRNFEEQKAAIFSSSTTSILACLQTPISAQRIKKQIETIYLNALKRICGFRLIARLSYMKHSTEIRTEYLNWFCSSLRHNTNILSHYSNDVTGCGEHLRNELRKGFFLVFNGIVKQIGECTDESEIKFLLNCCKWQFSASDHDDLIKSGIFEILSQGNGKKEKDKNPIKYCWGHNFKYDSKEDYPLCQDVLDLFEQVLMACFARIIKKDGGEEQKLKTSGTSIPGMEKAHSLVNTTTTEGLIAKGFKHVFDQLERYIKLTKKFEGIDWEFYVSKRNNQRKKGDKIEEIETNELEDENEPVPEETKEPEATESVADSESVVEEAKKEETEVKPAEVDNEETKDSAIPDDKVEETKEIKPEEDTKENDDPNEDAEDAQDDNEGGNEEEVKDKVREKVEEKENKEIEKLKKLYEEKYITRFLKLIEIFTSIAADQKGVLGMVLKIASPQELTILVDLLVYAAPRHGFTILKIFDNLFRIKVPHELFDESIIRLSKIDGSLHQKIMNINLIKIDDTKQQNKFENTPFLRFLFNYIVSIRAAMWNDSHFEGSGSFILSSMMLGILRTILNNDIYPKYQKEIINAIDHLIDNIDKYNLEEFEPLISVLNGAEYLGLGLGTNGVSSDGSMFTVLGFVQKWYGLKTQDDPNNNQNDDEFVKHRIQSHLEDKNDHILALYYDPKHPERTDIFTAIPEEVRLIPRLEKETNKILLDKTRINKFLRALKLDEKLDKGDYIQSTKRSIGLKILEQYLVDHGEELSKLIDTEFYNSFLKLLYSEACSPSSGKSTMQNDWIEQKIHALQEYAAENNSSLRTSSDTKARFADKKMVLSKVLKSAGNQRYSKCIDLVSAMNYGRVIQAENYRIAESVKLPEKDEDLSKIKEKDLRLIDPSEISTVDLMCKHLKTAKILLSCDVDIESMHKGLVEKDSEIAYFKSIVIVSKKDFMEIKQFLAEDPKIKVVNTEGLSSYEAFIKEMVEYGGFERKTLEEILKGNEEAPLSRKSNLVSDWCKQQEEKKDKEKKDKAEESKNSKEEVKEEKKEEKKEKDAKEMKDKKEEIKEEIIDTKEVKVKEGEKHDKDKKEESKEDKEAFDEETIFNLEKNDKFTKIFETVSKYGSTNYDDSANKPKKQRGTLFNNVYNVNSDNVEGEYLNCIGTYFVSMCRKTILSFFKISQVDNLLKLLLSSKHDTENFIKFVKIIGNELVLTKLNMIDDKPYEDLKGILGNIIKSCISNKEFTPFLHQLFKDVIVNGSIKGLKTALEAGAKDVKSYFNNETVAIETMNFYILVDLVNLYIKECPDLIFENHDLFKKFMTMLFLIPCVFRNDGKLQKNVYLSILKIVVLVDQSIEKGTYSKKIREHLLSLKIFKKLIECINFEKDSANSYNFKLTDEHKLLFEIFLKFSSIHKASAKDGIEPIYTYTESLLQMERCKIILKERKQFDMISYLMYLNELDDASKQSTILVDSQHPHFVPKVTACLKNEGFKKMTLKVQSGSELEKYSSVAITSDRKGENILKNIYQKDITDNKTEVTIFSDACYIHYPFRQPKIIAFGDKDQNKLGTDASSDPTKEPEVVPDLFEDLKCLANHQSFTAALDSKGVLYEAGFKTTFSQTYTKFTKHVVNGFKENEDKLVKMVAGFENIILLTEKGKIFIEGSNEQYQIDDSGDKYQFTEKKIPNDDDPVIDVSAGRCHHLIVTKSGKLYGAGNYFLKDIKIECGKKYAKIDLPNNAKALRVFCTNVEKPCVAFVLVEVKKGKTELWSAGESSKGLLGQGENTKKSGTFARLDYEHEKLNFVEVFAKYDHAMALTDDGQLYGWGCNIQHRLGLKKEGDKFKPTHIAFFKDYIVENVSVGMSHSLVIASPKTDKSKKMVFSIGKEEGVFSHYGITEEDSKNMEEIITHLKSFDHLEPYLIEAGNKTSFVAFRGDKLPSSGVSVHQEAKCEITGESPIQGIMYFYKDADNKMHCFSEKGYAKAKDTLPGIMFATKYPLKNLKCKFPKLKEGDLLISEDSDNDAKYPLYITNLKLGDKPLTKVELTETEFHNSNVNDIDPLVYYRISRPLAEGKELPVMNLSDYFDQTKQKGLSIELSPDYSYLKNDKIIDKAKETYKEIYDQVVKFPKQCDRELLECLEKHIKDNDLNFDETNSSKIEISPSSLTFKNKKLKGLPDKTKQQRINALLMYNQYFLKTIPYVLLDEDTLSQMATSRDAMSDKLNELFIVGKALAFSSIKNKYIKNIVNNLPCNWDQPECKIKRRKAQRFQDSGKVDHKGEYTIFGQIWSTLKKTNYNSLKKNDANTKAWSASLVGEGSIDGGGPYRETITNLCGELMHNVLPLLIPTPNNKNDHGLNRDCWTINPSAKSPTHLEMYEFLGALMGMAFRSGQILDLKLTSFFYKSLAGEPLTIEDLKAIDLYAVQAIKEIENTKKNVTEEMFDSYGAQTMTTRLSNQEEVDLIPKGKEITLKYKDIDEFVRLTLDARFKEAEKQMQAIRKGFEIVFPTTVMGILTWREVEYRIIGPTEIDMEELKKITNYSCCSETDEYVQRFWRAFEGFTQEERSMYLKFVWGRSRLPPPDSSGIQRHVIYLMYAGQYADHNQVLPQAHTCFFQLDLPRYTTDAACRDKVLYAIETCGEIDTDGYGRYADEDE